MGIVERIENVFGEVGAEKDHFTLIQEAHSLKKWIEDLH